MAFLGLDLGTGGVRALVIDQQGRVLGAATADHPLHSPAPGWMEQDPEDWWAATCAAIRQVLAATGIDATSVQAVAVSGQMHGATLLDEHGSVVRPCILWNDQRSAEQCVEITERIGAERLQELTGNVALAGFTAPKLLWVREREPDHWRRTAHVLLPRDYLNYRLTGQMACEPSDAAGTLLFNVRERRWSTEMLSGLALSPSLLPPVIASAALVGTIHHVAAEATGLDADTPVYAGGADNACAAAGCGVLEPGQLLCSIGTSGTVVAPVPLATPPAGHNVHLFSHVTPRANYLMGVVLSAGGAFRWFRDSLGPELSTAARQHTVDPYQLLTAEAASTPVGAEGLIFLPYLTGERTPHGSASARGVFFGLQPRHTRGHMARAVMEGVSYALGESYQLLRGAGVSGGVVRITGGGARSSFWRQIIADIFDAPVALLAHDEGPAYGAALIAAVGARAFGSLEEAGTVVHVGATVEPRRQEARYYRQGFELYGELYQALEPLFLKRLALDARTAQ